MTLFPFWLEVEKKLFVSLPLLNIAVIINFKMPRNNPTQYVISGAVNKQC